MLVNTIRLSKQSRQRRVEMDIIEIMIKAERERVRREYKAGGTVQRPLTATIKVDFSKLRGG